MSGHPPGLLSVIVYKEERQLRGREAAALEGSRIDGPELPPPHPRRIPCRHCAVRCVLDHVASLAIFIALLSSVDQRRIHRVAEHYELISEADRMIGQDTTLLRFRGVDPGTIEQEFGVTTLDLSYLLQMFNAGSLSYLISGGRFRRVRRGRSSPLVTRDLEGADPISRGFVLVRDPEIRQRNEPFLWCN